MNWHQLLRAEIETTFAVTDKLMARIRDESLDWKPSAENNWMTTGQLLKHLTEACGAACRGFITGDWGLPEGVKWEDLPPSEMLPPAEKLPAIGSVAEARRLLERDRILALQMVDTCSEEDLAEKITPAPWDPTPIVLGHRLLQMVDHLRQHKGQLFYYLKLQGHPVDTGDLYGV